MKASRRVGSSLALILASAPVQAQTAPAASAQPAPPTLPTGTVQPAHVSAGKRVMDTGAFATSVEPVETDATEATVQGGGLFVAGNTRNLAITTSADLRVRRTRDQVTAMAAANYARTGARGAPIATTVTNLQALTRYDRFFLRRWAAFLQGTGRHDPFQGLDLRLNVDPGVSFHALDDKGHRLWLEAGYDLQLDLRRDEELERARAAGTPTTRSAARHSVRAFTGYSNKVNAAVTTTAGLELIQSVERASLWRVNGILTLRSALSKKFSAATSVAVRVDNAPLPGVAATDVFTSVMLAYDVF